MGRISLRTRASCSRSSGGSGRGRLVQRTDPQGARRGATPTVKHLPSNVVPYQRTREFSESTIPDALRRRHTTKPGVWGRICVLEGSLRYRILEPSREEHTLSVDLHGVVEPEVPHEVEPVGAVRFYVEFLRSPE